MYLQSTPGCGRNLPLSVSADVLQSEHLFARRAVRCVHPNHDLSKTTAHHVGRHGLAQVTARLHPVIRPVKSAQVLVGNSLPWERGAPLAGVEKARVALAKARQRLERESGLCGL